MDRWFKTRQVFLLAFAGLLACKGGPDSQADRAVKLEVPRGYVARLEVLQEERRYRFGPFVGYYFQPPDPENLLELNFVVYNENAFYTLDLPANAKLFEGTAVFTTLPEVDRILPGVDGQNRINPVSFEQAPPQWLQSRPQPADVYLHFHSCYDARGTVRQGYWLRHVGVAEFIYDMGGRVSSDSILYHRVKKGVDRDFARLIEFDRGPR